MFGKVGFAVGVGLATVAPALGEFTFGKKKSPEY